MALPTIQREMHVEEARLQWVVCAFPLSSVSCQLLAKYPTGVSLISDINEYRDAYCL